MGTVSEGHRIMKDKSDAENGKYLICLEHRVGERRKWDKGGSQTMSDQYARLRCFNSIL